MELSECRFKQVSMGSIKSSIELMDEFISEKFDLLVIEPCFNYTTRSCTSEDYEGQWELNRKFRRANPQNLSAEELERCIRHCAIIETSEAVRNLAVVVQRDIDDLREICGHLTMTELRRGDWGWSSRCICSVDRDTLHVRWNEKVFEERFKKGDEPRNLFQSLKEFQYDHENEKLEAGVIYELRHPVILRAQTSSDREYYCWGGNKYGDTHNFYITGVVTSSWYSPIVR